MKITFEIPDDTKAFHGCLVYDDGDPLTLKLVTWDMPTSGIEDGMVVVLPPKKDGEHDADPAD